MTRNDISKHQRVADLLLQLGLDRITVEQFWQEMRRHGLTDDDIDRFCTGASAHA